jgi:hypothetical protein
LESAKTILALFLVVPVFTILKWKAVGTSPTLLRKRTLYDGRVYPTLEENPRGKTAEKPGQRTNIANIPGKHLVAATLLTHMWSARLAGLSLPVSHFLNPAFEIRSRQYRRLIQCCPYLMHCSVIDLISK